MIQVLGFRFRMIYNGSDFRFRMVQNDLEGFIMTQNSTSQTQTALISDDL